MLTFLKNDPEFQMPAYKKIILGVQHTFTMFGATVLVPILTGMNISVALFMAGASTLIFHLLTKGKVPAFMGSSFAFIAPTLVVSAMPNYGLPYAQGGIFVAGIIYLIFALLIHFFGVQKILDFFPPVVNGSIIVIIGLMLAPTAINMAKTNWMLALVSFSVVAAVSVFGRGFLQIIPVILGLLAGYFVAVLTGNVDFTRVIVADWFGLPKFTIAKFDLTTIMIIAPVAIATIVEHIGGIMAISATCNKDFANEPGLHRTTFGDGIAICVSSAFGGPAATTYAENTGVLALTKVFNPQVMRIAAVIAICLGVLPKLGALIQTIPEGVVGGISIILFGMIASIGTRTFVENKVDFTKSRNLIVAAVIFVLGLGGAVVPVSIGEINFTIQGIALAAIAGIFLNKVLPQDR